MERRFIRRLIKKIADNEVHVRKIDGEWQKYWAPFDGGYIRNITYAHGTLGRQITYKSGAALYWNGKSDMQEIIKEWLNF